LSVFYTSIPDLAEKLRDRATVERIGESVWQQRAEFMFDTHVDELIQFFRTVIESKHSPSLQLLTHLNGRGAWLTSH
jgi:hypothetical protein